MGVGGRAYLVLLFNVHPEVERHLLVKRLSLDSRSPVCKITKDMCVAFALKLFKCVRLAIFFLVSPVLISSCSETH